MRPTIFFKNMPKKKINVHIFLCRLAPFATENLHKTVLSVVGKKRLFFYRRNSIRMPFRLKNLEENLVNSN